MIDVLSFGGGRQTIAMCLLIEQGILPKPDRIVIADTGRENPSTWEYLDEIVQPRMQAIGLTVEIAPRSLAYVDIYAHNGDLLLPVYTRSATTGAPSVMSAFCSTEWKARVVDRYLRKQIGKDFIPAQRRTWIGFAYDERNRIKGRVGQYAQRETRVYPLVDLMLAKQDCARLITEAGLPLPPRSSCYMCPHKGNSDWRAIRDNYPTEWEAACKLDEEIREEDQARGNPGVWLHHSRTPLRTADIDSDDGRDDKAEGRQCALGMCFV